MPLRIMVGEDYTPITYALSADQLRVYKVASNYSGYVTMIRAWCNASGNLKCALTDVDGSLLPSNLLTYDNTGTAVVADQYNDVSVTPYLITQGTEYGIVGLGDTSGVVSFNSSYFQAPTRYNAYSNSYSSGIPNPLPTLVETTPRYYQLWGYGWIPPTVSGVHSGSSISDGDTAVPVTGIDFMNAAGTNGRIVLANNSDLGSATITVDQTYTSWSDSTLQFTVVQGALSAGTVYLFVVTDLDQNNATGYSVTLESSGVADAPQAGTFSYSGLTLSAFSAVSDTPQIGTFSYSGLTLAATAGIVTEDTPQAGNFEYSGLSLSATSAIIDTPLAGSFSYSGLNVEAVSSVSDTCGTGSFSYSGLTLDAEAATGANDTPQTGAFSYYGLELQASSNVSDYPESGVYSHSGLTLETSLGISDIPQGGGFSYSGLLLSAVSSIQDTPGSGIFEYFGLTLDAGPGEEVEEEEVIWNKVRRIVLKQITYGSSNVPLGFDAPHSWDVELLTGVTVQVADRAGTEVLAETACTLYANTTIAADAYQFEDQIILAIGSEAPQPGEMLTLIGVGAMERVIVEEYDAVNRIVKLETLLNNDYESGASVYGNTIEYNIDISDTDVFTAGKTFIALWSPAGTGTPIKTILQVTKFEADTSDIERRFAVVYPRAYEAFTKPVNKFGQMVTEAQARLMVEMFSEEMDYNRIIGEQILQLILMAGMARLWVLNADEDLEDERETINKDYMSLFTTLQNMPIWTDKDQDGIQNESKGEITSHSHTFFRSW